LSDTESKLLETQKLFTCDIAVDVVSVTDEAGIKDIARQVGTWDVLVLNAGYQSTAGSISEPSLMTGGRVSR
jgi:NADP-dependent 3-hydroxy acid dehydrogenase YdfG